MKTIEQKQIEDSRLDRGHFNRCEHLFIELTPGQWQTISVQLPNGEHVTFAFVPSDTSDNGFECCDIHTTVCPVKRGSSEPEDRQKFVQHFLGFAQGRDTFDTRTMKEQTTLATLLLGSSHYSKSINA